MVRFERVAPVFAVRSLELAMDHYGALGFDVQAYDGGARYAFASRDGIELHLAEEPTLKPRRNTSAVYLYVDDAQALFAEWKDVASVGRLVAPTPTEYGLLEGACLDRDANLIRFGSPLQRPSAQT